MLLTMKQLIERSGRSKRFVYDTLKKEGIELSDFYDDSVLRYLGKKIPDNFVTVGQMMEATGLSRHTICQWLHRAGIKAAERHRHDYYYDKAALDFLLDNKRRMDAEKKEREKRRAEKDALQKKIFEKRAAGFQKEKERVGYFFVSIKAPFASSWRIVACSLSYLDAALISAELNALGIKAHFRNHVKA